jgi:hypothetical protein
MSIETTENFWQALNEFVEPVKTGVIYRLYYDESGDPLYYSMEDLPGLYLDIDQETYSRGLSNIKVINGSIVVIKPKSVSHKMMPSSKGMGIPCSRNNICIVVSEDDPHTKWEKKLV